MTRRPKKKRRARNWKLGIMQEVRQFVQPSKGRPQHKFMIFAQGRTGSTLLTSLLDSHPDILCDREIFYYPKLFPYAYAERRARASGAAAYGFKVKIYQLPHMFGVTAPQFLDRFEEMGYKIIYLQRKNIVLHSFSNEFAMETKAHHFKAGDKERNVRFAIPPDRFLRSCTFRLNVLQDELRNLEGRDYLNITYEDDLQPKAGTWDALSEKIIPFLGVTPGKLSTPIRKSVQKPPSAYLENVEALHDALIGTPFAEYADSLYGTQG